MRTIKAYVWMWRELGKRKTDPPGPWMPSVMSHPRLARYPRRVESLRFTAAIHDQKCRREQHAVFPVTIEIPEEANNEA